MGLELRRQTGRIQGYPPSQARCWTATPSEPEHYIALAATCVQAAKQCFAVDPVKAKGFLDQATEALTKGVGRFPDHFVEFRPGRDFAKLRPNGGWRKNSSATR